MPKMPKPNRTVAALSKDLEDTRLRDVRVLKVERPVPGYAPRPHRPRHHKVKKQKAEKKVVKKAPHKSTAKKVAAKEKAKSPKAPTKASKNPIVL
jgi:hypothetical protein